METYYQDDQVTLFHGDALDVLKTLDAGSVDCVVTSPPYYGLRNYGEDGQLGQEESVDDFIATLVGVFHEMRRVLADDGTFWLNLGDSYANSSNTAHAATSIHARTPMGSKKRGDRPPKSLLGVPWRVALALQDDGWILRNDIIWHKNNGIPESVKDRLTNKHEHVFLFVKQKRYHFDLTPIREPHMTAYNAQKTRGAKRREALQSAGFPSPGKNPTSYHEHRKNPGDVWTLNTTPFLGGHFAPFPRELPKRCIQAGCKPNGTVLDPFSGSGTTGEQALLLGHKYVGIDINSGYLDLSLKTRLAQRALLPGEPA